MTNQPVVLPQKRPVSASPPSKRSTRHRRYGGRRARNRSILSVCRRRSGHLSEVLSRFGAGPLSPGSISAETPSYASCMRTNWRASARSFLSQRFFLSNRCSSAAIRAVISGKMISTCSRRSSNRRLSPESPRFATAPFFARPTARPCTFLRGIIRFTDMIPSRLRMLLRVAFQTWLPSNLLSSPTDHLLRFTLHERQGDFSGRNRYSLPRMRAPQ